MVDAKTSVTLLHAMIGQLTMAIPYTSQSATPTVMTENMPKEMSAVDLVRQVRIT
jgi:hypothetical protein